VAYVVAALVGALITVPILWWNYGALVALLGAPFGGSLLALVLALVLALRSNDHHPR
jgi:predicted membrane chloride channel (bestrophin family)